MNPSCKICNHLEEDINHVLFQCRVATTFWEDVRRRNPNPTTPNEDNLTSRNWLPYWVQIKHHKHNSWLRWDISFPYCLWHIWLNRNNNSFNNKNCSLNYEQVYGQAAEFALIIANKDKVTQATQHTYVNIDGASSGNPGEGGLGRVFRDHDAKWTLGVHPSHIPHNPY